MRFVVLSDTHNYHRQVQVPDGDVLLFAGDMCGRGTLDEVRAFGRFLEGLPHAHKIVIAGNHDWPFELAEQKSREALGEVCYLQDESVEVEGVKIYGSPWQPEFCQWAFNLPRGDALRKVWARIPDDTQVLLTHGPPHGILDMTHDGRSVGCEELLKRVLALKELKLHLFGHIHEAYGNLAIGGCRFINASICDLYQREASKPPQVFDL